jgi:glucoamylase
MASPIEHYAMIGDYVTAALVDRTGSIDWLCLPRFDSPSCLGGLLGDDSHGHWRICPSQPLQGTRRRYLNGGLVLVTEWQTETGRVELIDFMPVRRVGVTWHW